MINIIKSNKYFTVIDNSNTDAYKKGLIYRYWIKLHKINFNFATNDLSDIRLYRGF